MNTHNNVAIFVPHNGCPHKCSFCDQISITGKTHQPTAEDVKKTLNIAVDSLRENTKNSEIAFFGGSFTAIKREYMISLLDATKEYIDKFKGIRISTRPDYIDNEILSLLKSYNVTSIELGAQSMDDLVLDCNNRGHNSIDVVNAANLIKSFGFSLGLQMMTGLYMSNDDKDIFTAKEFIKLKPDTVRIYPTIIMKNTYLGKLFLEGKYKGQSLENAVVLCSKLLQMFYSEGINVIRLGLHDSESLKEDKLSGPYHPAFRELCESRLFLEKFLNMIKGEIKEEYIVHICPKSVSKFVGNNKSNIKTINQLGIKVKIEKDESVDKYDLVLS